MSQFSSFSDLFRLDKKTVRMASAAKKKINLTVTPTQSCYLANSVLRAMNCHFVIVTFTSNVILSRCDKNDNRSTLNIQ